MKNILIFSGTSEGRILASKLAKAGISSIVSVATEYGNEVMENCIKESEYISVHTGRMDIKQMETFIIENNCGLVIDATHPFAVEASKNIKKSCLDCNVQMIRCLRENSNSSDEKSVKENEIYVNSLDEAVDYLNTTVGNILVTTGSKEIGKIAENINDKDRIYTRVLPNTEAIGLCEKAGIKGAKIYAMQGPFDEETNRLMLRLSGSKYLLTKESGNAGGFDEKISAAIKEKAIAVVIKRPSEQGLSLEKTYEKIIQFNEGNLKSNRNKIKLTLVGIGMGSGKSQLTGEAADVCSHAGIIFGAERVLESVSWCNAKKVALYSPDKIKEYLDNSNDEGLENIVVAFSGDTGFYSGAKAFLEYADTQAFENTDIKILPGITTVQYFAAKLGIPWQDIELCSIHGRNANLIGKIKHGGKRFQRVFTLASSADDVKKVAASLVDFGMGDAKMYVAVNLSYPDERIYVKRASEFIDFEANGLIAFIIENTCKDKAENIPYFHMPDDFFIRSNAAMKNVPMTKSEIRAVSVAKLMLEPDSVVYDVGAGTGSVSVECANIAVNGQVYAIEKNPEAVRLIDLNKKKAVCENLHVIEGKAPDALECLPAPTHAFIGGSSGNLRQILDILYSKNPKIRIVINAVTLETQSEILSYIKDKNIENAEIITIQVSRSEKAATYHMMKGENPVMIATLQSNKNYE
jgi:precorrin-6Y C5,15-methyltransferase (decarboxylating)